MKKVFLLILFFFPVVFLMNTTVGFYTFKPVPIHQQLQSATPEKNDPSIATLVSANSYADISVQPTTPNGSNMMRRYRPAGFSVDKMLFYITEEKENALVNSYKFTHSDAEECMARQKMAGYYLYSLCKIII